MFSTSCSGNREAWQERADYGAARASERGEQVGILREVFGNPFRPASVDPSWLNWNDATVVKMAQGIYHDRAFDRSPILADALEDAGCTDADILYCPSGWLPVMNPQRSELAGQRGFPILTNWVSFEVP